MSTSLSLPIPWPRHIVEKLFYVKGRIGWRGLRHDEFTADGPYLITGIHIQNGRVDWSSCYHIPKQKYNESPEIMVSPGDLVITKDGTIGKVALIEEVLGLTTINSHLFLVRPLDPTNGVNSKFAYHVFSSFLFTDFVKQWMSGSTLSGLGEAKFLRFQFPVPPMLEQFEISRILDTIDEAIAKTEAVITKRRQVRAGLLHDLLTRGLDEHGRLRDPIAHSEQFQSTPLGLIPCKWQVVTIESIGARKRYAIVDGPFGSNLKTIHYRNEGVPVIQSGFVTSGGFQAESYFFVDKDLFEVQKRSAVEPGDLVMAKIGAQCGKTALLPEGHPVGILAGNCLKISTYEELCRSKFLVAILHYFYEIGIIDRIKTETAQPAISLKSLRQMLIPLPPPDEQDGILSVLDATNNTVRRDEAHLAKLRLMKSGLMEDLFTGRMRVPEEII